MFRIRRFDIVRYFAFDIIRRFDIDIIRRFDIDIIRRFDIGIDRRFDIGIVRCFDIEVVMKEMQYLTIALTKGRLAGQTMELFEKAGYYCEELKDKKSRKLIFTNEEQKLRFFLSKGPDVPTYVEYGAADIGIVGSDIILEEQRRCHEVLDLGFGKCRMCVAGPPEARELLQHHEMIRVASKYPNIAKEYFYNRKHQTVDIIKLNGSVELGPIVELADVIVDIVETGSTLQANRLQVLEEVLPISARMIVNQVSMQMKTERVREMIDRLRDCLTEA